MNEKENNFISTVVNIQLNEVSSVRPQKKSRLSSKLFYKIFNHFSDTKAIMTERFKIISRRAINRVLSGYNIMVPYHIRHCMFLLS